MDNHKMQTLHAEVAALQHERDLLISERDTLKTERDQLKNFLAQSTIFQEKTPTGRMPEKRLSQDLSQLFTSTEILNIQRDLFFDLFDMVDAILLVLRVDGQVESYNRCLEELSGIPLKVGRGMNWFESFLPPDDQEEIGKLFEKLQDKQKKNVHINPILTSTGELRFINWRNNTVKDDEGNVAWIISVGVDVTAQIEVEKVLRENQQMFQELNDAIHDAIWLMPPDRSPFLYQNPNFEQFWFGKPCKKACSPECILKQIHPEDRMRMELAWWPENPSEKQPGVVEFRLQHPSGIRWIRAQIFATTEEGEAPNKFAGVASDITERKAIERMLHDNFEADLRTQEHNRALELSNISLKQQAQARERAESTLKTTPQRSNIGDWSLDLLSGKLSWSKQNLHLFGFDDETHITSSMFSSMIHPEDRERCLKKQQNTIDNHSFCFTSFRIIRRDGVIRNIETYGNVRLGINGEPVTFWGTMKDVTEEKRLKNQQAEAQRIGKIGHWTWNLGSSELNCSEQISFIFGVEPGALFSVQAFQSTLHNEDKERVLKIREDAILNASPYFVEYRILHPSGIVRVVEERGEVELFSDGSPLHIFGTIQDVTQQKMVEERLRCSLLEKDVLLKEVHHRVKNNLQIIIGLFELQRIWGSENCDPFELLRTASNRIRTIASVHEALYCSPDLSHLDCQEFFGDIISGLQVDFLPGLKVQIDVAIDSFPLSIDQAIPCGLILNEVLTNSIIHAFPGNMKGNIEVRLEVLEQRVILSIVDNGVGISDNPKKNNHLGLRLVERLTKQINGTFNFKSSSSGTSASISFPNIF